MNKKGFTLAELVVVIAIIAIIIAMASGFLIYFRGASGSIEKDKAVMNDVSGYQVKIKEWLYNFDNEETVITVAEDKLTATYDGKNYVLTFNDCDLVGDTVDGVGIKYDATMIEGAKFSQEGSVICCTLTYGVHTQDLKFALFSNTKRNRYSDPARAQMEASK